MKRSVLGRVTALLAVWISATAAAANDGQTSDVFYGGTIGLGFGEVNYVELSPLVGRQVTPELAIGGSLIYRHRSDDRYRQKLTTDDYGASVFGRYRLTPIFYAQAEYEYLNYEYYRLDLTKDDDIANSVFVGGGVISPLGGAVSLHATALYNVLHDEESPYASPWVIRFGVGVGF